MTEDACARPAPDARDAGAPGGTRDAHNAVDAPDGPEAPDAHDFTPEEVARGRALRRRQTPVLLGGRAAELALLLALGLTPAGASLTGAVGGPWWAVALWGTAAVVVAARVVRLPFAARVRVVRHGFGLVTQGWGGWWADVARGLAITLPLACGALVGLYALVRSVPGAWWWAACSAAAASLALSWLAPLLLEPVFNRFTPMPEGELRSALLALAGRDGVRVREVLVADASRRTTALNAYVSGFGATRRIVVYDTLLSTAADREVELVVAHELGHVVHRDVLRGTLLGAVGAAAGVGVLATAVTWQPMLDLAGVERFADPRSLPLLVTVAAVLGVFSGPLGCAISRRIEARADRHALELTADPEQFVAMQRRLSVANVSDVDPPRLLHALFGTHPSAVQRIAAARAYAAEAARAADAPDGPPGGTSGDGGQTA